jgi:hypothetical protein
MQKASELQSDTPLPADRKPARHKRRWRWVWIVLVGLAIVLGIARAMLPWAVRRYVNRTLDQSQLYQGKIGTVHIHLWRGAYSIDDVRLLKITGNVPVPLYSAKRVDFAIEWSALAHRRVVGRMLMEQPQLNFVDAPSEAESQTGAGGPWLEIIRDLFPFKINSAVVRGGSIHFRTFQGKQPVDVYLSNLEASVDNLTNIGDETTPLIATVKARALAMDHAKFEYDMRLDPFSYRPTFHLAVRLLGLDVTKINDLAIAYGKFDFERGWFDLVVEMDSKEGILSGYVKPLFRHLKVLSMKDVKEDNPLQLFWEALVGLTTKILTNPPRDQFGTLIPFNGDVTGTKPDVFATIGNVLRNAFVRAYLPRLQRGAMETEPVEFGPSEITDPSYGEGP